MPLILYTPQGYKFHGYGPGRGMTIKNEEELRNVFINFMRDPEKAKEIIDEYSAAILIDWLRAYGFDTEGELDKTTTQPSQPTTSST